MSVYLVIKSGLNGGAPDVVGVYSTREKALAGAEDHTKEVKGWWKANDKMGRDVWYNEGYEWAMTIEKQEVR